MTSMSAQSETCTVQSGLGSLTRLKVFCVQSGCVKRSLGNGLPVGLEKSSFTLTPAARAKAGAASSAAMAARRFFMGCLLWMNPGRPHVAAAQTPKDSYSFLSHAATEG